MRLYCPELINDLPLVKTWVEKRISDYEPAEFAKRLKKSLAEIVFITGGKMYDEKTDKDLYAIQLQTISKFLINSFHFFSFEEIIQAFYLNSSGKFDEIHSHYGREMNIEFIGKVLSGYKNYKQGLYNQHGSELVKAIKGELEEPPSPILTDEDYLNDKRKTIEQAYQRLITTLEIEEGLFPEYFYDVLVDDGLIAAGLYEKNLDAAKEKLQRQTQVEGMWKDHKEKERNNGRAIDPEIDDGKSRYEDRVHIGKALEKVRWLAKNGLLKKYQPAVTLSKQMIVKEFFMICFRNNDPCIYAPEVQ